MNSQTVDEVTEWDSREFSGGYAGLRDLAAADFTGAVTEGMTWLFMLNGRIIGVFDGSIESFEDADGTAYETPHASVALLFAMRETGGQTQAKYYTEDTPLSEVDETLSSGSFTGYVELSENVLSGDYYLVYQGGRSLACAFVGNSRKLLTDDEAFERADDEVGIYQVHDVDIDVIEIPEPAGGTSAGGGANAAVTETSYGGATTDAPSADATTVDATSTGGTTETSPASDDETGEDGVPSTASAGTGVDTDDSETTAGAGDPTTTTTDAEASGTVPLSAERAEAEADDDRAADRSDESDASTGAAEAAGAVDSNRSADSTRRPDSARSTDAAESTASAADADANTARHGSAEADAAAGESGLSKEEQWREARAIPSLDPSKSATGDDRESDDTAGRAVDAEAEGASRAAAGQSAATQADPEPESDARLEDADEQIAELRERLHEAQQARDEAETARERLATERQDLKTERDEYRQDVERLRTRVEELESEVQRLEGALSRASEGDGGTADRTMSAREALDGTNLFIRYGSKSGATLEKAHAGEIDRSEVVENLSLEHHTGFDTDGLRVDGQPYEEFLRGTIEYSFVRWVVEDLLYEILDTGHTNSLDRLFDTLPELDRAELYGSVSIQYVENGEEHREQQTFDVVLRDRMGNPLLVANLNDSRDPATEDEMTSLVQTARRVKESSDSLGAALFVTASYFQPEALETAADATGGGLLGRGKRKSFVKLSRKRGFHLCLIETRDGNFHVNVPEL